MHHADYTHSLTGSAPLVKWAHKGFSILENILRAQRVSVKGSLGRRETQKDLIMKDVELSTVLTLKVALLCSAHPFLPASSVVCPAPPHTVYVCVRWSGRAASNQILIRGRSSYCFHSMSQNHEEVIVTVIISFFFIIPKSKTASVLQSSNSLPKFTVICWPLGLKWCIFARLSPREVLCDADDSRFVLCHAKVLSEIMDTRRQCCHYICSSFELFQVCGIRLSLHQGCESSVCSEWNLSTWLFNSAHGHNTCQHWGI